MVVGLVHVGLQFIYPLRLNSLVISFVLKCIILSRAKRNLKSPISFTCTTAD